MHPETGQRVLTENPAQPPAGSSEPRKVGDDRTESLDALAGQLQGRQVGPGYGRPRRCDQDHAAHRAQRQLAPQLGVDHRPRASGIEKQLEGSPSPGLTFTTGSPCARSTGASPPDSLGADEQRPRSDRYDCPPPRLEAHKPDLLAVNLRAGTDPFMSDAGCFGAER